MPLVGFEPTISTGEWLQTYALDHTATGTGFIPAVVCCYSCLEKHKLEKDL